MLNLLFSLLVFSAQAADLQCVSILTSIPDPPSTLKSEGIAKWVQSVGGAGKADLNSPVFAQRLDQLNNITPQERELHLSLELATLFPATDPAPVKITGREELVQLSAENLQRMLSRLETSYPITKITTYLVPLIDKHSQSLHFSYLRTVRRIGREIIHGPEVSDRERLRLGIETTNTGPEMLRSFDSVPWQLMITNLIENPGQSIPHVIADDKYYLDTTVAEASGFLVPIHKHPIDLFDFFDLWAPGLGEQIFESNRATFPRTFQSYAEFRHYLTRETFDIYFPPATVQQQLAPFRTQLRQHVLSVADAKMLIERTFRHWALFLASIDRKEAHELLSSIDRQPSKIRATVIDRVLPFLYMPQGMSLRLPLGASASQYTVIRMLVHDSRMDIPQFGGMRRSFGSGMLQAVAPPL